MIIPVIYFLIVLLVIEGYHNRLINCRPEGRRVPRTNYLITLYTSLGSVNKFKYSSKVSLFRHFRFSWLAYAATLDIQVS